MVVRGQDHAADVHVGVDDDGKDKVENEDEEKDEENDGIGLGLCALRLQTDNVRSRQNQVRHDSYIFDEQLSKESSGLTSRTGSVRKTT